MTIIELISQYIKSPTELAATLAIIGGIFYFFGSIIYDGLATAHKDEQMSKYLLGAQFCGWYILLPLVSILGIYGLFDKRIPIIEPNWLAIILLLAQILYTILIVPRYTTDKNLLDVELVYETLKNMPPLIFVIWTLVNITNPFWVIASSTFYLVHLMVSAAHYGKLIDARLQK